MGLLSSNKPYPLGDDKLMHVYLLIFYDEQCSNGDKTKGKASYNHISDCLVMPCARDSKEVSAMPILVMMHCITLIRFIYTSSLKLIISIIDS